MLNRAIKLIIIAIMIPIFIYFWPSALGGDAEILIVQGKSMLPTIQPGSLVVTKQAPSYEIDDIVSFTLKEGGAQRVIVHRIIDQVGGDFIIKGDNNPKKDVGTYSEEEILGKVVFATPYVGDLLGFARNPLVLVISAVFIIAFQMEQKRRKKHKEKMRRIRLGLPKPDPLLEESKKKPKKPDYSMFYGAIAFNVITYVLLQVSMSYDIKPKGDMLTGFLFGPLQASFASTLIVGLYFLFIFGLYFAAKAYEKKSLRKKIKPTRRKSTMQMLLGKNANPVLSIAQLSWMLFILMSLFHLIAIGQELQFELTCDPAVNLDCR